MNVIEGGIEQGHLVKERSSDSFTHFYLELNNLIEKVQQSDTVIVVAALSILNLNESQSSAMIACLVDELRMSLHQHELLGRSNRENELLLAFIPDQIDMQLLHDAIHYSIERLKFHYLSNLIYEIYLSYVVRQAEKMLFADQLIAEARSAERELVQSHHFA